MSDQNVPIVQGRADDQIEQSVKRTAQVREHLVQVLEVLVLRVLQFRKVISVQINFLLRDFFG